LLVVADFVNHCDVGMLETTSYSKLYLLIQHSVGLSGW
jgi:hypothetical protein